MNRKSFWALAPVVLWAALVLGAWFLPGKELSVSERRPLAQMPSVSVENLLSGRYMSDFEKASLDQFPLREGFRRVKSLFHTHILGQRDNNGIYLTEGTAVKQEYPLNATSLQHALSRFDRVYRDYLEPGGCRVYAAMVPDKGYYLAEQTGHLALDYGKMEAMLREGMPWAEYIDLTGSLTAGDYYRTDTHWRQERLLGVAELLCARLEAEPPREEDFRAAALEEPFYGVYYGQAALPMEPDTLYVLESDLLESCTVYDYETGAVTGVYSRDTGSRDLYDVFLGGAKALLTIENPGASTDRELIIFRDSFGSSLAPLLVQGYARVTLVDIRYINPGFLGQLLEFDGQDVLFLYSSLVLNNSSAIK